MSNYKTFDLFLAKGDSSTEPDTSINYLTKTYGEDIFQRLLNNLLQQDYAPSEATTLWNNAMRHLSQQNNRLNWRAAILDYLLCRSELNNPIIIETEELRRLQRGADTDRLTDLYNQPFFKQQLANSVSEASRQTDTTFSLLLLDLDHFRQLVSRGGPQLGDKALKQAAELIVASVPENSIVCHYSGDQFAAILPQTDLPRAIDYAEDVRATIEKEPFSGEELLDSGRLTVSCGIATFPGCGQDSNQLLAQANSKLHRAKRSHNKVMPGKSDTRHAPRHSFRNIVEIFDNGSGQFKNALSADISRNGILLKSSTPAIIGSPLKIRFPYPFWPNDHYASGQVRHLRRNGNKGGFLLGIEFNQPQCDFIGAVLPATEADTGH